MGAGVQGAAPIRLQLSHAGQLHRRVAVRLKTRLDIARTNLKVEGLLVERNFAGLHQQWMLQRRRETFLLPRRVANTPDQFERRLGALRCDGLLQRKKLVVSSDGFAPRALGCRPGLPLVLDVPVKEFLDFRVVRQPRPRDFTLAVIGHGLSLDLRALLWAFR